MIFLQPATIADIPGLKKLEQELQKLRDKTLGNLKSSKNKKIDPLRIDPLTDYNYGLTDPNSIDFDYWLRDATIGFEKGSILAYLICGPEAPLELLKDIQKEDHFIVTLGWKNSEVAKRLLAEYKDRGKKRMFILNKNQNQNLNPILTELGFKKFCNEAQAPKSPKEGQEELWVWN